MSGRYNYSDATYMSGRYNYSDTTYMSGRYNYSDATYTTIQCLSQDLDFFQEKELLKFFRELFAKERSYRRKCISNARIICPNMSQ